MKNTVIINAAIIAVRNMLKINFANNIRFFSNGEVHTTSDGKVADSYKAVKKGMFADKELAKVAIVFSEDGSFEIIISKNNKVTSYYFYKNVEDMENNIVHDVMYSIQVKH